MITLATYLNGRDLKFPADYTPEIKANAIETVRVINILLEQFTADTGVVIDKVSSGWRPAAVNEATSNAGKLSTHIKALAVDLVDTPDRLLARWVLGNRAALAALGCYVEDPRWSPTWLHCQRVPPASGKRVYVPSLNPPLTAALSKWVKAVKP